jgi:hypothetical protein
MMPHDVNAVIAKIVFILSAACVLTMAKVRAEVLTPAQQINFIQTISK